MKKAIKYNTSGAPLLKPKGISSKNGFSLVELMVVMVVIGVLSIVGIQVFTGVQANARERTAERVASELTALIQSRVAYEVWDEGDGDIATVYTELSTVDATGLGAPAPLQFNPPYGKTVDTSKLGYAGEAVYVLPGAVWTNRTDTIFVGP